LEGTDVVDGLKVWVPAVKDVEGLDEYCVLASVTGGVTNKKDRLFVTVTTQRGDTREVDLEATNSINEGVEPASLVELSELPHVNDMAVLDVLRARHATDVIYTWARPMLLVVNPFRDLGNVGDSTMVKYQPDDNPEEREDPHIFGLTRRAWREFCKAPSCHSFVISGESGAGKTETTKHVLKYLSAIQRLRAQAQGDTAVPPESPVQKALMQMNPILEAWGNAKTVRNDNSSRFGKFMKMYIEAPAGLIVAGSVQDFLLERSRVVGQGPKERGYHIFYQLSQGLEPGEKADLHLKPIREYQFFQPPPGSKEPICEIVDKIDDKKEWQQETLPAFDAVGVSAEDLQGIKMALSGILLCGEVKFALSGEETQVANKDEFHATCSLLGLPETELTVAVTTNTRKVGGEMIQSPVTVEEAVIYMKSIARSCYGEMFAWLIKRANEITALPPDRANSKWIAVLDIFGFEAFEQNSIEQFFINYTNERLQRFFTRVWFDGEIATYSREGIDSSHIEFDSNVSIITLIDSPKNPPGILAKLNDVCASNSGTDKAFTQGCHSEFKQSPDFVTPKMRADEFFLVRHSAGEVKYCTVGWKEKNRDVLKDQLVQMLKLSGNPVVKSIYEMVPSSENVPVRQLLTSVQFLQSIQDLMNELDSSAPHFIRCIKPAASKKPRDWVQLTVADQLHCLSIIETLVMQKKGFVYRKDFTNFLWDFETLSRLSVKGFPQVAGEAQARELCEEICGMAGGPEAQVGKTMVFMTGVAHRVVLRRIKEIQLKLEPAIVFVQNQIRGLARQREAEESMHRLVVIQANARRYLACIKIIMKKRRLAAFSGAVLLSVGVLRSQRRVAAVGDIVAVAKTAVERERYRRAAAGIAATRIQRSIRTYQARSYLQRIVQIREQARLQAKLQALGQREIAGSWRRFQACQIMRSFQFRHSAEVLKRCALRFRARAHLTRFQTARAKSLASSELALLRSFLSARHAFLLFKPQMVQLHSAVMIQKFVRGWSARRKQSACCAFRGLLHAFHRKFRVRTSAATRLQAIARGFIVRSHPRMRQVMEVIVGVRELRQAKQSATKLSALSRSYLAQREFHTRRAAAACLQTCLRRFALRRGFFLTAWLVRRVQAWWRGWKVRQRLVLVQIFGVVDKEQSLVFPQNRREAAARWGQEQMTLRAPGNSLRRKGQQVLDFKSALCLEETYPEGWIAAFACLRERHEAPVGIAVGSHHTVCVASSSGDASHRVYAWGSNDSSQLGHGTFMSAGAMPSMPIGFEMVPGRLTVAELCCGSDHTVLRTEAGAVFAWGSNGRGQCGVPEDRSGSSVTHVVPRPRCMQTGQHPSMVSISAGPFHTAVVGTGGSAWMCGHAAHIALSRVRVFPGGEDPRFFFVWAHAGLSAAGDDDNPQCGERAKQIVRLAVNELEPHVGKMLNDVKGDVFLLTQVATFVVSDGVSPTPIMLKGKAICSLSPVSDLVPNQRRGAKQSSCRLTVVPPHVMDNCGQFVAVKSAPFAHYMLTQRGFLYSWGHDSLNHTGLLGRPADKTAASNRSTRRSSVVRQLGVGAIGDRWAAAPRRIPAFPRLSLAVGSVSVGHAHAVVLTTNGRVFQWGKIECCRKGRVQSTILQSPTYVKGLLHSMRITQVSAGWTDTFVRTEGGEVFGWGVLDRDIEQDRLSPALYQLRAFHSQRVSRLDVAVSPSLQVLVGSISEVPAAMHPTQSVVPIPKTAVVSAVNPFASVATRSRSASRERGAARVPVRDLVLGVVSSSRGSPRAASPEPTPRPTTPRAGRPLRCLDVFAHGVTGTRSPTADRRNPVCRGRVLHPDEMASPLRQLAVTYSDGRYGLEDDTGAVDHRFPGDTPADLWGHTRFVPPGPRARNLAETSARSDAFAHSHDGGGMWAEPVGNDVGGERNSQVGLPDARTPGIPSVQVEQPELAPPLQQSSADDGSASIAESQLSMEDSDVNSDIGEIQSDDDAQPVPSQPRKESVRTTIRNTIRRKTNGTVKATMAEFYRNVAKPGPARQTFAAPPNKQVDRGVHRATTKPELGVASQRLAVSPPRSSRMQASPPRASAARAPEATEHSHRRASSRTSSPGRVRATVAYGNDKPTVAGQRLISRARKTHVPARSPTEEEFDSHRQSLAAVYDSTRQAISRAFQDADKESWMIDAEPSDRGANGPPQRLSMRIPAAQFDAAAAAPPSQTPRSARSSRVYR